MKCGSKSLNPLSNSSSIISPFSKHSKKVIKKAVSCASGSWNWHNQILSATSWRVNHSAWVRIGELLAMTKQISSGADTTTREKYMKQ